MSKKLFLNLEGLVLSAVITGFVAYEVAAGDVGKKALLFMGLFIVMCLRIFQALVNTEFKNLRGLKMWLWVVLIVLVPIGAFIGLFNGWPNNFYLLGGCAFLFLGPFIYLDHCLYPQIHKLNHQSALLAAMVHPVMILVGTVLGFLKFNSEMLSAPPVLPLSSEKLEELSRMKMVDVESIQAVTNLSRLTDNQSSFAWFLFFITAAWLLVSVGLFFMNDQDPPGSAAGQEPDSSSSATAGK
jgi:hypothetical protein